jgi:hypothetical protein
MKNSKKYAKGIAKLHRELKKKLPKVKPVTFDDPAEALVYAVISEDVRSSVAKTIRKRIKKHFIDLNELRVSRQEEICEQLGSDSSDARRKAQALNDILNDVFQKFDRVNLEDLKEMGKRQARKELDSLESASSFVLNYCFLTALEGHAVPLTPRMIEYLKAEELVDPDATDDDIEGFLERQISASSGYEFYSLLRRQSETSTKKLKKTAMKTEEKDSPKMAKKKTAKKATKKKNAKKKTTAKAKTKTKKAKKKTVTKKKKK